MRSLSILQRAAEIAERAPARVRGERRTSKCPSNLVRDAQRRYAQCGCVHVHAPKAERAIMSTLTCEHGCIHERAQCTTADCRRCYVAGDRECNVARFVDDNRAACQLTFAVFESSFLTGFTSRAAAALVHLREAWCIADASNRRDVELSIQALMSTRSLAADMRFQELLVHSLDEAEGERLLQATR